MAGAVRSRHTPVRRYDGRMHPTYEAAVLILRDLLAKLRSAVNELPDEAMDWRATPNANSVAILVIHTVRATRFLLASAAGARLSREEYQTNERLPSFEVREIEKAHLLAEIDTIDRELETLVAGGNDATLTARFEWVAASGRTMTGAECLLHVTAHLSEHAAQAGMTRDLWLTQQR